LNFVERRRFLLEDGVESNEVDSVKVELDTASMIEVDEFAEDDALNSADDKAVEDKVDDSDIELVGKNVVDVEDDTELDFDAEVEVEAEAEVGGNLKNHFQKKHSNQYLFS